MPITTLPPAPQPTDDTATFNAKAFALLAALQTFVTEANAVETAVDADAAATSTDRGLAQTARTGSEAARDASQASAQAAAASAGASIWITGTTYAIGDVRWSPATRLTYRRITAGAGSTDPSADPTNWALAAVGQPQLIVSTSTSNALSVNSHTVLTNAALSTATLPASPVAGDTLWVTVGNGRTDNVIARNGQNIMSLAEDMTLDSANATAQLRFINSTLGWRIV
jgi:hypothetical protein